MNSLAVILLSLSLQTGEVITDPEKIRQEEEKNAAALNNPEVYKAQLETFVTNCIGALQTLLVERVRAETFDAAMEHIEKVFQPVLDRTGESFNYESEIEGFKYRTLLNHTIKLCR